MYLPSPQMMSFTNCVPKFNQPSVFSFKTERSFSCKYSNTMNIVEMINIRVNLPNIIASTVTIIEQKQAMTAE